MDGTRLDDLLASAIAPLPERAAAEAANLATATKPRRRMRRRWLVPTLVLGAFALTAGSSASAIMLSHWSQVGIGDGNVMNEVPIPVVWTTEDGLTETCKAWIELANPQPGDRATLDAAIKAHDWTGFGQRLYDSSPPIPDDADGEGRVTDRFKSELLDFSRQVFPGIEFGQAPSAGYMGPDTGGYARGERGIDSFGFRCEESR